MNEERLYQRLEALESKTQEHAVLLRETSKRIERLEGVARELERLDVITTEVQRRVERLERLPDDVSEIKQDVREIRSRLEVQGGGFTQVQSIVLSILMLLLGYLLNTLPRLLGVGG